MKWFRIILPIFLIMGMLLCINSVAYADDPPDPNLNVDIVVAGDNPIVDMGIYGDNPQVWINGQNLSEPTAVYNISGGVVGVDGGYVNREINEALAPFQSWANEYGGRVDLTVEGLAKLILLVQEHGSEISTLTETLDSQGHIASLMESASEQRMSTLESQVNHLTDSYNNKLTIIIGAFSLVVIGLVTGLVLLWRRTRISA